MVEFKCPKCDAGLSVAAQLVGAQVACPDCGQVVAVPGTTIPNRPNPGNGVCRNCGNILQSREVICPTCGVMRGNSVTQRPGGTQSGIADILRNTVRKYPFLVLFALYGLLFFLGFCTGLAEQPLAGIIGTLWVAAFLLYAHCFVEYAAYKGIGCFIAIVLLFLGPIGVIAIAFLPAKRR